MGVREGRRRHPRYPPRDRYAVHRDITSVDQHLHPRVRRMCEGRRELRIQLGARGERIAIHPLHGAGGWHHSAVLEIAKNRAVIGEYQPKLCVGGTRASRRPHDGDPIRDYYSEYGATGGIISEDQFYRVQAIISGRAPRRGRGPSTQVFTNLFIGIGRCDQCGGRMGMHTASKHATWNRSAVLRCYASVRGMCENKKRFKYDRAPARGVTAAW